MTARRFVLGVVVLLSARASANAQGTVSVSAAPSTLGPITGGLCGTAPLIPFDVQGIGAVSGISVSLTATHGRIGHVRAWLTSPNGTAFSWLIFNPGTGAGNEQGYPATLAGTYRLEDSAPSSLVGAAFAAGTGVVPPGTYQADGILDRQFRGVNANGTWLLGIGDCYPGLDGNLTAATLTVRGVPSLRTRANPGSLGGIPDGPSMSPQTPGAPRDVTFTVAPGRGHVQHVRIAATLTHGRVGDLVARLIAPSGESHVLFGYTGASDTGFGYSGGLNGAYEFRDDGSYDWWLIAASSATVPPASYTTSAPGGPGSTGAVTAMDAVFAGLPSAGTWTLRVTDGAAGAAGTVTFGELVLETDANPSTTPDAFSTPYATPVSVSEPGVLGNDAANLGGALSAVLVAGPAHGILTLSPAGAFTYAPAAGFAGVDTFTYRAVNAGGSGSVATVSISVGAPATVLPPTNFMTSAMSGNLVALRWTPPVIGPPATDFVVEGGLAPGQVLGTLPIGGPLPILTVSLPTGAFYLRVHAIDAAGRRSGPSNEIRIFVNVAAVPSAPAALAGTVDGNALGLAWRNTFDGGLPTALQLSVSGTAVAALSLPLSESFSFAGVPAGTYTFRVRATNVTGSSLDSPPVTLTFPDGCPGAPSPPEDFLAYALGNVVHLVWNPPAHGAAATNYVVTVGGSFTGSFPSTQRSFQAPAPPGAYTFSVASVGPCGVSTATGPQTVLVP